MTAYPLSQSFWNLFTSTQQEGKCEQLLVLKNWRKCLELQRNDIFIRLYYTGFRNESVKLIDLDELSLKSNSHLPKKTCFNESSIKIIKNAFYFTLKYFFFLKDFLLFFSFSFLKFQLCRKYSLIIKIRLISKFRT